jgi:chromosome segregation ATPase
MLHSDLKLVERLAQLETQVHILKTELRQLREQTQRPPTAKETLAAEKEALYDELERELDDLFDLYPAQRPARGMAPTEIVAELERAGVKMRRYGPTDHSQKTVLGRILRRMDVQPQRGTDSSRVYFITRKA